MGYKQGRTQTKQQNAPAPVQQMGAFLYGLGGEQQLRVGQRLNVFAGDLVYDLPHTVGGGQLRLGMAALVAQGGQLAHQGAAELLVAVEPHRPADPHHAGRRGKSVLGQLADGEQGGFFGVFNDKAGDLLFGCAERGAGLPQTEQGVFHRVPPDGAKLPISGCFAQKFS